MIPHGKDCRCALCKAEAEIDKLTDEQIVELPVWKAWEIAFPFGTVAEVSGSTGIPYTTLDSWTRDPETLSNKGTDLNGRRGLGYELIACLTNLNGVFYPGAQFLLRFYSLKLARGEAIKGNKQLQAVMDLVSETKAAADEARAAQEKASALAEKLAAVITQNKKT